MLLRRALKFSLPWILLCAVFWKPLLEGGMGLGVKAFLQMSRGWKFDYRSVAWGEKGLIFTDFILDDPNHFWLRAEEAVVVFSKRHLEIEKPRIVLRELPRMKGAFSWTCHFHQGNLEGEGIAPVQFEAERGRAGGHVQLDWKEGTLKGEVVEEQGAIKVDLALQEFRPEWLRRWLGNELKGTFSGKAYVVWEEGKWARGMGKLQGKEVGWKEDMRGVQGVVDWEGPFDREQFFQNGRFRVHLAGGKWLEWSEIRGEGNFVGGMGTKWEFAGVGREKFPVAWKGRGFFQNAKAHWVESDLSCGEACFTLKADKKKQWAWEGKCERVGAEHAGFLQSFLALVDPIFGEVALLEGMFDLQGKGEGKQWELMAGSAEGLKGKGSDWSFAVQKGNYAPSGEFFFEGGKIEANWLQISPVWNGKGKIEGGRVCESEFEGKWEESLFSVKGAGSKEEFSIEVREDGPLAAEGKIEGKWDGEKILFIVERGEIEGLQFAGKGWMSRHFDFFAQIDAFYGPIATLWKLRGEEGWFEGKIEGMGNGFTVQGGKSGWDWSLQAQVEEGSAPLISRARLEGIEMQIGVDPTGFSLYEVKGNLMCGKEIPFYCPIIQSSGEFDIRLLGETWDLLRFSGVSSQEGLFFDLKKSHLLGAPFQKAACSPGFERVEFQTDLPWTSLLAVASHFFSQGIALPLQGGFDLSFFCDKEGAECSIRGANLFWDGAPLLLDLYAFERGGKWTLDHFQWADFSLAGEIEIEKEILRVVKGHGKCEENLDFVFEGKIEPFSQQMEWNLSSMKIDLGWMSAIAKQLGFFSQKIEGILEGTGHLSRKEEWESDFDFAASSFQIGSLSMENQGPLHVYFSPKGALFRGLDLQIRNGELDFSCRVDLLQYDIAHSFWGMQRSHIHLPRECFRWLPFLEMLQPTHDIDLIADLSCSSDFSFLEGSVREGFLPFEGVLRHVQQCRFFFEDNHFAGNFSYFHQGHLLKVGFQIDTDATLRGRFLLYDEEVLRNEEERPLVIDWSRENGEFLLHSIEGNFGGIEALFHEEEPHSLIGSARLNFTELSEWIPPRIAEVFRDLKMGKGYEIKGHIDLAPSGASFRGLLSGKQLELFGYQLRTLLGQLEITPQKVHLSDLKVSDSAGILKIEELLAEEKAGQPWTISMPRLTITELRPCLLQKVGQKLGDPSPLVVRELTLKNFRGILEDSRTYTASGELFFINSYRRDHTVFDIPADVLSRIVGLDLEILIPICGSLKYELKERLFRLTELKDSYSAGKRTQFFLVDAPTMDLDGNLQILVKMKQFVLFKFTESFLISIEGKLDDPKFHLQKKRRFLGL